MTSGHFRSCRGIKPCWIVLRDDLEAQTFALVREGHTFRRVREKMSSPYGDAGVAALRCLLTEISVQEFFPDAIPVSAGSVCNMILYMTNRCNLRCKHCYRFQEQPGDELPEVQWGRGALAESAFHTICFPHDMLCY
jgi:hypothetical protein